MRSYWIKPRLGKENVTQMNFARNGYITEEMDFVAPFMILISTLGLIFRDNTRKIFYFPIGLMGISILLEKDVRRRLNRLNILKKIKSYQKVK